MEILFELRLEDIDDLYDQEGIVAVLDLMEQMIHADYPIPINAILDTIIPLNSETLYVVVSAPGWSRLLYDLLNSQSLDLPTLYQQLYQGFSESISTRDIQTLAENLLVPDVREEVITVLPYFESL